MSRLLISLLRHHPDMPPYTGEHLNLFRNFLQDGRLGRHRKGAFEALGGGSYLLGTGTDSNLTSCSPGPRIFCHKLAQTCNEDVKGLPGSCIIEVKALVTLARRIFSATSVLQVRTRKRILLP